MRPPPPKKNDYCFFFLSQGEVESFHSSHVWPVSMLLLCRLECVGRKSFADYKMCVSDSMLWLCLILVCFFLQIFTALFLSFICSLCLHLSCSLFLFFLILPSCLWVSPLFFAHHLFSKSFFSPSSPRVSLFILLFYLFPFVVFCYYSFIVNSFIFCCSFFLLPLLFPSSPQLSFSIFHSYYFLFFSWFAFLSHLFLVSFPHTLGPCILFSFPFFPFPRFPISHPAPFL